MAMFENVEDVIDMIAIANPLGRLEEGEDPKREAVETAASPEAQLAAMAAAGLIPASALRKVKGVVSDPIAKSAARKLIGRADIPTTGTVIPPEVPKDVARTSRSAPKAAKASGAPKAISSTAKKATASTAAPVKEAVRKSVSEMRGGVNASGLSGKLDDFTKGSKFEKIAGTSAKKVAKEGGEEVAKKGIKKFIPKTMKGKFGAALALYFAYNQMFGEKKKKAPPVDPDTIFPDEAPAPSAGVSDRMKEFNATRDQINNILGTLGEDRGR